MKRMMLYFGSFNPIHNGHIALAEWVVEQDLCDELALIISPQNPLKESSLLAPDLARLEMAEVACAASRYPDKIKPSAIEFLLPRPSYTIDTLRYLSENFGNEMTFSVLMGGDLVEQLDQWKEYEQLLAEYKIYVYPRTGYSIEKFSKQITYLAEAPTFDYSSTQVRQTIETGGDASQLIAPAVMGYIRQNNLWSSEHYFERLDNAIEEDATNVALLMERGQAYFRRNEWGKALNDFGRVLEIEPKHTEAQQLKEMIYEILQFRYTDLYNP